MTWQDVFENEKAHARESMAALFEPLACDMLDALREVQAELAALRRGIELEG